VVDNQCYNIGTELKLKEGEMPDIFKALATIMAWILWIVSLVMGFSAFAMGIITGALYSTTQPTPMIFPVTWAVSLAFGIGAIVVMLLRKKME
jgi:hypothetical protein